MSAGTKTPCCRPPSSSPWTPNRTCHCGRSTHNSWVVLTAALHELALFFVSRLQLLCSRFPPKAIAASTLPERVATRVVDLYGTASADVFALAAHDERLAEIIDDDTSAIAAEIVHARVNEGAFTLEDILVRRTLIGTNADVGLAAAPRAAGVLVDAGEWTAEDAARQVENYRNAVRRFMPRALEQASSE